MKSKYILYCGRYVSTTALIPFIIMVTGVIVFFTADCIGQETENQKLSPEAYAKSIVYENPGILKAHDILPKSCLKVSTIQ